MAPRNLKWATIKDETARRTSKKPALRPAPPSYLLLGIPTPRVRDVFPLSRVRVLLRIARFYVLTGCRTTMPNMGFTAAIAATTRLTACHDIYLLHFVDVPRLAVEAAEREFPHYFSVSSANHNML